jgi:hypothetical protein
MMMHRRTTKAGIVLESLLFLAALGLFWMAFSAGADTFKLINSGETANGVITNVSKHGFSFLVQFNSGSSGQRVFEQEGLAWGRHTGDEVPVIYDPNNPERAVVDWVSLMWSRSLGFALAGLALFILGFRLKGARSL